MNSNFTRATVVRGVFWTYSSYYIGKIMVLVSTVILARLLVKSDFGVVSFALLIIGFLDTINSAGISSALIYYEDDENTLYNSAFWLNLALGGVMFAGAWLLAPLAGNYFDDIRVVSFTQALAFVFLLNSLEDIPKAILTKNLSFKVKFLPDTLHALVKGGISILFAFLGFGAWSLVIGHLAGAFGSLIMYWIIVPWRPKFRMTIQWIRSIFSYGTGIVATSLLSYILINVDYLFVGYFLGAAALGVYTIAFRIPDLLIVQFCSLVGRVVFPVFVKLKNDPDALKAAFLRTMNYVSLITIPLGLGLMLLAGPFVLMVFTDKWSEAIPVMKAISLYALFLSLAYNATHAYKAHGAISLMTSISALRTAMLIPALWWASSRIGSIEAIAWTHAVVAFIGCVINIIVAGRVMHTSLASILLTLRAPLIAGAVMSISVLGILHITSSLFSWIQLITGMAVGVVSYTAMLAWIQKDLFTETWLMFRTSMFPQPKLNQ